MIRERLKSIDCLKGIAILSVILGHSIQFLKTGDAAYHDRLFNYIYSFHMPLFMFISGFVSFKIYVSWNDIKKRAYQLLPPFIFCPILASLIFNGKIEVDSLFNLLIRPEGGLWFLYILFIISSFITVERLIIQNFFSWLKLEKCFNSKKCQSVIILVAGFVLFSIFSILAIWIRNVKGMTSDYGTSLIAQHSIFYFVGMIISINIEIFKKVLCKKWFLFALVWLVLSSFWEFDHKPTFIDNPSLSVQMAYFYLTAFSGVLMMLSICLNFIKQDGDSAFLKFFTTIGSMTLGLYAIHLSFVMEVVCNWVNIIALDYWIKLCILFLLSTIISIVLVKIIELGNITPQLLLGKVRFINGKFEK